MVGAALQNNGESSVSDIAMYVLSAAIVLHAIINYFRSRMWLKDAPTRSC